MTKEELLKLSRENLRKSKQGSLCECYDEAFIKGYELSEKQIATLEKENTELKSENQKWKDEWQEQVQKATDEGYARTLQTMQLTKAKDIIKEYIELKYKPCAVGNSVNMLLYDNICAEAEQFLKEIKE